VNPSRLVLLGDPVSQSLSPVFQNAALGAAAIKIRYEAARVGAAELSAMAAKLAAEGAAGNVTVPHKVAFLSLCDVVTPVASRVGAVNTFWSSNGKLNGDNTDVGGFDAAARELLGEIPDDLTVAVIGAGGAAAAIIGAVESWPNATARLYARNATRASALAKRFGDFVRVESSARSALAGAKLIVNATPIGMSDDSLPFSLAEIPKGAAILDLVYKRGGTALVRSAQAVGFRAADGTTMLIEQGALSFARWFGLTPDKAVMRAALV
jgi:shikimate dehydrogenase